MILGGTAEASRLAENLAGDAAVAPLLSLAGRTRQPVLPAIPARIGGFGGVEGLVRFLRDNAIAAVIDATHPFAAQMSSHAAEACARLGLPRAIVTRPPWTPDAGDDWTVVTDLAAAAVALGAESRRVFLTTGRLGLATFRGAPQHAYLARSIDCPGPADRPPTCRVILDRGPFSTQGETALMRGEAIEVLVTKNSGGEAGRPKLLAARDLGLPVVIVARPPVPAGPVFTDLPAVRRWLAGHGAAP